MEDKKEIQVFVLNMPGTDLDGKHVVLKSEYDKLLKELENERTTKK